MSYQAYGDWLTTVREHLTRAVTCRLAAKRFGEDVAFLNYERYEIGHRFIYINPLLEKLKEYEQSGEKFRSFEEFFPELIAVFKTITPMMIDRLQASTEEYRKPSVRRIPETGSFDENNVIIITPTKEKDTLIQRQLCDYIENDYRWNKKIEIIADTVACTKDLSDFDLIVFGTIHGNTFLSRHFKELPIIITETKIVTDKQYAGSNLQLITGWINPCNSQRSMLIYTAQEPENILKSNRIPYNIGFTIAKANKVICYGNFKNHGQIWFCE